MAKHPYNDGEDTHFALNASKANSRGGCRLVVVTSRGDGQIHRWSIDQVMPEEQVRELLLEIREQADEQLQKLWPETEEGRHRA